MIKISYFVTYRISENVGTFGLETVNIDLCLAEHETSADFIVSKIQYTIFKMHGFDKNHYKYSDTILIQNICFLYKSE